MSVVINKGSSITCFLILFCLYSIQSKAQPAFSRAYDFDSINNGGNNILVVDNRIWEIGFDADITVSPWNWQLHLNRYELSGTLDKQIFIDGDSLFNAYNPSIINGKDGTLIISFVRFHNIVPKTYTIQVDTIGDTIWSVVDSFVPMGVLTHNMINARNNSFLQFGSTDSINPSYAHINGYTVLRDSMGGIIWQNYYSSGSIKTDFFDALQTTDGGFLLSGVDGVWPSEFFCVTKIDSAGNFLQRNTYNGGKPTSAARSIVSLNDTSILVVGPSVFSTAYIKALLVCVKKSDLSPIWMKEYGAADSEIDPYEIIAFDDTSFLLMGQTTTFTSGTDHSAWFLRINNKGDSLWCVSYAYNDSVYSILYDIKKTPDNGFVGCGYTEGEYNQDVWILKLDSNGCLVEGCWAVDTPTAIPPPNIFTEEINIYPNPFSTKFTITNFQNKIPISATLVLYDVLGREVLRQAIYFEKQTTVYKGISQLPQGIYTAVVYADTERIFSKRIIKQ